jgi:very-short-patch-repair endonuclease
MEHKIIIELDGSQHFKQVSNWQSPENCLETDKYKMNCANKNGFHIIRILQDDVFNDKNQWDEKLKEAITELIQSNTIKNIFICNGLEYDLHI